MSECFSYHYLIKNKNYDFYLSILVSERGTPFFWQPPYMKYIHTLEKEKFTKAKINRGAMVEYIFKLPMEKI